MDLLVDDYRAQIGTRFRSLVYDGITTEQVYEDTQSTCREAEAIRNELAKLDDNELRCIIATDPGAEYGNEVYLGMSPGDILRAKATNAVFAAMGSHHEGG